MKKHFLILIILIGFVLPTLTTRVSAETAKSKKFEEMTQKERVEEIKKISALVEGSDVCDIKNTDEFYSNIKMYKKDTCVEQSKKLKLSPKNNFTLNCIVEYKYNRMYNNTLEYYSVIHQNKPDIKYLYSGLGSLLAVEITKNYSQRPPYFVCRYSNNGDLSGIDYYPTLLQECKFDSSKNFQSAKVNYLRYNKKGINQNNRIKNVNLIF